MDSKLDRTPVAAATALATAGLYWFGTNLTPIPWLTWLAPLPVLLPPYRAPCTNHSGMYRRRLCLWIGSDVVVHVAYARSAAAGGAGQPRGL